jgi:hypothetical protein
MRTLLSEDSAKHIVVYLKLSGRVPLMEKELITLSGRLRSPPVVSGASVL